MPEIGHDRNYVCLIAEVLLNSLYFIWQFITSLKDNLNAEVALGTVTNVKEACAWLGYTYLFIRMKMNPLAYGIGWDEVYFRVNFLLVSMKTCLSLLYVILCLKCSLF